MKKIEPIRIINRDIPEDDYMVNTIVMILDKLNEIIEVLNNAN